MRALRFCLAVTLLLPFASAGASSPRAAASRRFRLIAYDYKQSLDATTSYDAYHQALAHQIEAASARFTTDRPTLAFLPEDTGLLSWFVGVRGIPGRIVAQSARNSTAAIAALAPTYAPQVAYYEAKCPGIPAARALGLALTDTAWRAFGEGLAAIARRDRIWIMANLNAGDVTVTRDPVKVALLADPTMVTRGYAYEAGCHEWNTAFLFRPDERIDADGAADPAVVLAGEQKKVYLVPVERTQDLGLAMDSESPAGARAIATPFARFGVLTSKDAWMPDVVERLEIDGMDVFMQPEAGAWAGHDDAGLPNWAPDNMKRAIWSMVQWQAETSYGALADLTGNFGDLYFDGTATIVRDATPGSEFLLGRDRDAGIVARAPWVFPDPPAGVAFGDLAARRRVLDAEGSTLVPGSGQPTENGQLANFVVADIELPLRTPAGTPLPPGSPSVAIAASSTDQWAPSFAVSSTGTINAAWTDLRGGFESPYTSTSANGATWAAAVKAGDSSAREFDQQDNQYDAKIAVAPDGSSHLVWLDFRDQSWDVYGARSADGRAWTTSNRVDHSPSSAEGFPFENLDQSPSIAALPDGRLLATWADARGRRVDHNIVVASSRDGGVTWAGDTIVDGSGDAEIDQWSPALAAGSNGTVALAWQDRRSGIDQIYLATAGDGEHFGEPVAVAPSSSQQWQPSVAVAADGAVAVAWSEGRGGGARSIKAAIVRDGHTSTETVDPRAPPGARQARPAIAFEGSTPVVVWQDDRGGDWDVLLARIGAPGIARVDDGPAGTDARLPVIAARDGAVLVAWEDTRTGVSQIRMRAL